MKYVVVIIFPANRPGTAQGIRVHGTWDSAEEAEKARRRIYFDARKENTSLQLVRSIVVSIDRESR